MHDTEDVGKAIAEALGRRTARLRPRAMDVNSRRFRRYDDLEGMVETRRGRLRRWTSTPPRQDARLLIPGDQLEKLLEVCRETRAKTENDREDDISIMAKAPQEAARRAKDPGITAPFQATIAYNAQIAQKAVQTRRKNAEEKPGQGGGQTPPAPEAGQTPPAQGSPKATPEQEG